MTEEIITKTVENVDKMFPEIVVNGQKFKSNRYSSNTQAVPATSSSSGRAQSVQGQDVHGVDLNNVLHDFVDPDAISRLEALESKVPSEASSSNKLADKSFVGTSIENAINELDVATVGGSGKYIKSIRQVDGKIEAVEDNLTATGGLAFTGTRAQYEQAKLIPEGQTGHIPSGALVCITDENTYLMGEEK